MLLKPVASGKADHTAHSPDGDLARPGSDRPR